MDFAKTIAVTDGYTGQNLIEQLPSHFPLIKEQSTTEKLIFFDTFDWRLYNASLILYQSGDQLILCQLSANNVLQYQTIAKQPTFVWDIPDGALKTQLEPIIQMRALLKLNQVHLSATSYRLLNEDEKTVVRLSHQILKPDEQIDGSILTQQILVQPLRGYDNHALELNDHLEMMGLVDEKENFLLSALSTDDKKPGDYSARFNFQLDPHMRADEAAKTIHRYLLTVIRHNETGVKQDIDTEFLHDFRVAVRRTRSALSQIKGVFSEETTLRFKTDFAYIGKQTNDLRDLDVYLLAEDSYKAMLPDTLCPDIAPLFDYLKQKRSIALQQVNNALNSKKYAGILSDWQTFLDEPLADAPTAPNASVPIVDLARSRITKKYRRVVKWGKRILKNTEDEQLHALRLECKKLRYLMEFFDSLFPSEEISMLVKQLKKLQNNLGDFNDLCVQEEYLLNIADEMPLTNSKSRRVFLAIGCLIGTLRQERELVKADFAQTFINFTTPANKKLFNKLLKSPGR